MENSSLVEEISSIDKNNNRSVKGAVRKELLSRAQKLVADLETPSEAIHLSPRTSINLVDDDVFRR